MAAPLDITSNMVPWLPFAPSKVVGTLCVVCSSCGVDSAKLLSTSTTGSTSPAPAAILVLVVVSAAVPTSTNLVILVAGADSFSVAAEPAATTQDVLQQQTTTAISARNSGWHGVITILSRSPRTFLSVWYYCRYYHRSSWCSCLPSSIVLATDVSLIAFVQWIHVMYRS